MADIKDHLNEAVLRAIQFNLDKQVEQIVLDAEERLRKAIHRVVADAAITAHNYYSMERSGEYLIVKVKIMDAAHERRKETT